MSSSSSSALLPSALCFLSGTRTSRGTFTTNAVSTSSILIKKRPECKHDKTSVLFPPLRDKGTMRVLPAVLVQNTSCSNSSDDTKKTQSHVLQITAGGCETIAKTSTQTWPSEEKITFLPLPNNARRAARFFD